MANTLGVAGGSLVLVAALLVAGCSSGSSTIEEAVVASADSGGGTSGLGEYEPGTCPYPMEPEPAAGGQVVRPKVMSEFQPTLEEAARQAAGPCFEQGATLHFRRLPHGTYPGDEVAAVSDGTDCFQFGWMGGGGRWRVSGQVERCEPFSG